MSMVPVPTRLTRIKVRRPAEWRLLERSQPMMAESTRLSISRNRTDHRFSSPLHWPRSPEIQSFSTIHYLHFEK